MDIWDDSDDNDNNQDDVPFGHAQKAEEHHVEEQQVPCKIVPAFRFYSHLLFNDY
jgi:hypothetical protein